MVINSLFLNINIQIFRLILQIEQIDISNKIIYIVN